MSLIIIIISLALEMAIGRWQHLRRLAWVSYYRESLFRRLPPLWADGWRGLALLLLPVLAALLFLQYLFSGHMHGILELALGVAVLTYCLGPEPFNDLLMQYIHACERQNVAEARAIAKKFLSGSIPQNIHQLSLQVTRAVFYEANKRIFAVLLWFLLLGPMGALLYRVVVFLAEDDEAEAGGTPISAQASILHGVLDWLPARLLGLTFFLTGSFDDALDSWRKTTDTGGDIHELNRALVIKTGCAAMRHEVDDSVEHPERMNEYDLQWLRTARMLIIRSLIVWLAVIAFLMMAGFF
jgi:AmpE protein